MNGMAVGFLERTSQHTLKFHLPPFFADSSLILKWGAQVPDHPYRRPRQGHRRTSQLPPSLDTSEETSSSARQRTA